MNDSGRYGSGRAGESQVSISRHSVVWISDDHQVFKMGEWLGSDGFGKWSSAWLMSCLLVRMRGCGTLLPCIHGGWYVLVDKVSKSRRCRFDGGLCLWLLGRQRVWEHVMSPKGRVSGTVDASVRMSLHCHDWLPHARENWRPGALRRLNPRNPQTLKLKTLETTLVSCWYFKGPGELGQIRESNLIRLSAYDITTGGLDQIWWMLRFGWLAVGTLQTSPANACAGKGYICHGSRTCVTHGRVQIFWCGALPLDFYVEGAEKGRRKWLIDGCTG